jgi:hypothetical protein
MLMKVDKIVAYDGKSIRLEGQDAYELGNCIGKGTSAVVYKALCIDYDRYESAKTFQPFAIKMLRLIGFGLVRRSALLNYTIVHEEGKLRWQMHPGTKKCGDVHI